MNMMTVRENRNRYLMNFTVLVLAWGGMLRESFNCDTLTHMVQPRENIDIMMQHGRYLTALQDYLLYQMGLSTTDHTGVTALAEILLLALALCIVQCCFEKTAGFSLLGQKPYHTEYIYERLAWLSLTALMFVNVLFAESFMFGECALMFGMAYLLASLGVLAFTRQRYGLSFLCFFLSTMEYQAAVIYGAILLSAWIFMENKCCLTVKAARQELFCGMLTVGSGVLNIWSLSLLAELGLVEEAGRSVSVANLLGKLGICLGDLGKILVSSRNLLPAVGLPLLMLIFAAGLTIWKLWKEKGRLSAAYYLLLIAAMLVMVYILPMVQHDTRTYPRFVWTFYAVQSMLLLIAFWGIREGGSRAGFGGRLKKAMCYACSGYLLVQILFCNIIVANHMVSNTLDKTYAMMVYQKILEYEEETGQRVGKLAVVNDIDAPFSYNNVYYKTDQINERALGTVTNTLVNVVSGRVFEKVPMDEGIYNTYFADKDWDYFDASQQLVIIGDTAYWAVF